MTISSINSFLDNGVLLGDGSYSTILTVGSGGGINSTAYVATGPGGRFRVPSSEGITAIQALQGGNDVINYGAIQGGNGATYGGAGIKLVASSITNFGVIHGGNADTGGLGVFLSSGYLVNDATIRGGNGSRPASGVYLDDATLLNAGTICGGGIPTAPDPYSYAVFYGVSDAISFGGSTSTLIAQPGAVFYGAVVANNTAGDELELAAGTSSKSGILDMGGSFSGFSTIDFNGKTSWLLAGTTSDLASGQEIIGFGKTDTLQLEDFKANSYTYIAGTGLVLSNGSSNETVHLIGSFETSSFNVRQNSTGTGISLSSAVSPSALTISGSVDAGITISETEYSRITVLSTGTITPSASYADGIYSSFGGAYILNDGVVSVESIDNLDRTGIVLINGTLSNFGTIIGTDGLPGTYVSPGGFDQGGGGGLGVRTQNGVIQNNGVILGGGGGIFGGIGGVGVLLTGSYLINEGTIIGGAGGSSPTYFGAEKGGAGVNIDGGTLINAGVLSGGLGGNYTLNSNTLIEPSGPAVSFGYGYGTLVVDPGAKFEGEIAGFRTVDTILLSNFNVTSDTYVSGIGLEVSDGSTTETLNILPEVSGSSFSVTEAAGNAIIRVENPICYLRGTRVQTPAGVVEIEKLRIDDAVVCRFGGYKKIKWIGRQSYTAHFIRHNRDQIPVRICTNAFAPGLPTHDLYVSPGHSMLIGNVLILARFLVNGVTITQDTLPEHVHYYQLELDSHDCILAEGIWSESFCDYGSLRNQFHNVSEFYGLYPNHAPPEAHNMCAVRPQNGAALATALLPIIYRATSLVLPGPLRGYVDEVDKGGVVRGWAQDVAHPELPVILEAWAGRSLLGRFLGCDYRADLDAAGIGQGRAAFRFEGPIATRRGSSDIFVLRATDGARLPLVEAVMHRTRKRKSSVS